jgi:hypothetical protein
MELKKILNTAALLCVDRVSNSRNYLDSFLHGSNENLINTKKIVEVDVIIYSRVCFTVLEMENIRCHMFAELAKLKIILDLGFISKQDIDKENLHIYDFVNMNLLKSCGASLSGLEHNFEKLSSRDIRKTMEGIYIVKYKSLVEENIVISNSHLLCFIYHYLFSHNLSFPSELGKTLLFNSFLDLDLTCKLYIEIRKLLLLYEYSPILFKSDIGLVSSQIAVIKDTITMEEMISTYNVFCESFGALSLLPETNSWYRLKI